MQQRPGVVLSILLISLLFLSRIVLAAESLPALAVDIKQTSVSGLSSGAFMTSQLYVVNSDIMVGAGIIAGGPYLCAQSWVFQDYLTNATAACMSPLTPKSGPNVPHLVELTQQLADAGKIDNVENLKDDKIYIFTGKSDKTVLPTVVEKTRDYFLALGVPEPSIMFRNDVDAGHAIITNVDTDVKCDVTKAPYINDCDFFQAYEILNFIYPDLKPPATELTGEMIKFNQKEFIDAPFTSMSDNAYVYVPAACKNKSCKLHVVLHGCEQGADVIGDAYYGGTGYNYMAESNDFVMLYPQAKPSKKKPFNPKGCWDFWGYSSPGATNPDYFTREAPQLKAMRAMVDRLAEQPGN